MATIPGRPTMTIMATIPLRRATESDVISRVLVIDLSVLLFGVRQKTRLSFGLLLPGVR